MALHEHKPFVVIDISDSSGIYGVAMWRPQDQDFPAPKGRFCSVRTALSPVHDEMKDGTWNLLAHYPANG
jgi:hypothetical protein